MKVKVEILDKEKQQTFTGTIEVPTDAVAKPYSLQDQEGNEIAFNAISWKLDQLRCVKNLREDDTLYFDFEPLYPGKPRVRTSALDFKSGKFVKTSWKVTVTLLG